MALKGEIVREADATARVDKANRKWGAELWLLYSNIWFDDVVNLPPQAGDGHYQYQVDHNQYQTHTYDLLSAGKTWVSVVAVLKNPETLDVFFF